MRKAPGTRLEALLELSQSRRPSEASKETVKQYVELAMTSKQRDDVQEQLIIDGLHGADVEVAPRARVGSRMASLDEAVRRAGSVTGSKPWNSITASEHRLVAAQLRLTTAAMAGDRKKTSEMAMQNSKIALVFAALDPAKVEIAFSQVPLEELRGIIRGLRKVMGGSGWLRWFESREGITNKFCRMLTELKGAMSEQLQDAARVKAAYRFLQRMAPELGDMLAAWSEEAFRIRREQRGGGWVWLHRVRKSIVTFLKVLHIFVVAALDYVLYVPALICKLVYPREGADDDRWKTSVYAWPFFANHVMGFNTLRAVDPQFTRRYMRDPKERAEVMESRFMHANRGRQFASQAEYQRTRQEWIAANTSRFT